MYLHNRNKSNEGEVTDVKSETDIFPTDEEPPPLMEPPEVELPPPEPTGPKIPPMSNYTIDLRSLTVDEEETILAVLERDSNEMQILDGRIDILRKEIQEIRKRGVLVKGDKQNKMCARCKRKFWLVPMPFSDKGVRCIKCKFRICKHCRTIQTNGTWLCSLCLRFREEKMLSGDWIFKGHSVGLYGSDLMRASFRDRGQKKFKRRRPEATESSALVRSTSPSKENANVTQGDQSKGASGQRRGSYSKALENQKIRVILPPGKDGGDDGHRDSQLAGSHHLPLHDGKGDVDVSDNSSLSSQSSAHPQSKNASTNSSFSSRSSKSMPSDTMRAHDHSDAGSLHRTLGEGEMGGVHAGGDGGVDSDFRDDGSNPNARRPHDRSGYSGTRGKAAGPSRKDSFEEIYDSNVNRLVEMMTGGGPVSDTDSTDARNLPRLLPRPPGSGKDSEYLQEKRLSLSEELEESLKYLKLDDECKVGENDDDVHVSEDDRVDKHRGSLEPGNGTDDQTGSSHALTTDVDAKEQLETMQDTHDVQQGKEESENSESNLLNTPDSGEATGSEGSENATQESQLQPQQHDFESLEEQDLMLSNLRNAENDLPHEFMVTLCRSDSNASDSLSRITEMTEPCGEADSNFDGEHYDSDDTLHEGNFEDSFSDDTEVTKSSKGSVINIFEASNGGKLKKANVPTAKDLDKDPRKQKDEEDDGASTPEPVSALDSGMPDDVEQSDSSERTSELKDEDLSISSSVLSDFDSEREPPQLRAKGRIESKTGGEARKESARDSDSGVNSSQTSRANTPEQRSLSSEKGTNQNSNSLSPRKQQQVPAISVTEETREEDDDLDELFQKHRSQPGGSNLSTRSSLRDSRESLYSVYSAAGEENYGNIPVTGEILFNLEYAYKTGVLAVHIKQCKELAPVDTKRNRSDPYVKTYLLPDKTRNGKRKTKIKRHTLNPTYNEVLHYTISKTELESRSLWISVWNNDRFGRNDFLGEVTIPLDYYDFDKSIPLWYALQDRIPDDTPAMTYKGDLFISLKYVPASMVGPVKKKGSMRRGKDKGVKPGLGEIHVMVKEAQNLTAMRSSGGSNPFCKGYLLPDESHHSKQKTQVVKKTTSPLWQHLLVFDGVDEIDLEHRGVELTVWDHETLSSNDFLGGVRLNLGTGFIKGKSTDWMDARGEEIDCWQRMIDMHNEWIDVQLPLRSSMGNSDKK